MSNGHSLELVIHVSTERRDGAALALASSRRCAAEAQRKLDMLARYYHDYLLQMGKCELDDRTDSVRLSNARAFILKLEQAIEQQQREVESCDSRSSDCFRLLSADERKLKSLETLRDRRTTESACAERRLEQKRTDEYGARAALTGGATLDCRPA